MSKQFEKYAAIIRGDVITEREISNLKKLLNGYSATSTTITERKRLEIMIWAKYDDGGLELTAEQTAKGIKWLLSKWKTPRGVERKNSPFGYREQETLEHFTHFKFLYFYDLSTAYQTRAGHHNYQPVYGVYSTDAPSNFEYYMQRTTGYNGGEVEIIG